MNMTAPDLTPPTKKNAAVKAPKEAKPKVEKAPADPNAPKKERAPRQDYGFAKDAIISVTPNDKSAKYRGDRKEWYDRLDKSNGKSVEHFLENNKGILTKKSQKEDHPRGWLRFFVREGAASLSKAS